MGRLLLLILSVQLAACGPATLSSSFNPRARILVLPSDISRVLQLSIDNAVYTGNAQPGPLEGQVVPVASLTGSSLTCTLNTADWKRYGPGYCRDGGGRQYDMLLGENARR
jgi:hypothetical protein